MTRKPFRRALICLLCLSLLPANIPARADSLKSAAEEALIGIIAVGAAIVVVAVYFAKHRSASIQGCVAASPNGLEIKDEGDQRSYQLGGLTSDLKIGDNVRVKGKKESAKRSASPTFEINKLVKDYGACPANANP